MVPVINVTPKDTTMNQDYFARFQQTKDPAKQPLVEQVAKGLQKVAEVSQEEELKKVQSLNKVSLANMGEKLADIASVADVSFNFEFHTAENSTKKELVLKVVDKSTKEVISQFPSEISMKIAQMLQNINGTGQIADAKV